MDTVLKLGLMVLDMRATTKTGRRKVMASSAGVMEPNLMANLLITTSRGKEPTYGLMGENSKVIGL
jgi:hypothetical protein